jgi:hypothetical protein
MRPRKRVSPFGDAIHTVALERLRRRSAHRGRRLLLAVVLAAVIAAIWGLLS